MVVNLVLLQRPADARAVDWTPSFFHGLSEQALLFEGDPGREGQVKVLVERVVQLIRDGVTGMDLLEVFLRRRIQPLQARGHPMWMYSGTEDTTRIHPEEVEDDTLEGWLTGIIR